MTKIIFTDEQVDTMIDLYTNHNQSTRQLGKLFNVSKSVIGRVLKENNIELNHVARKYYSDFSIFEKIDTEEKAYWLGFIAADGCNYQREGNASLIINIHQKDKEHLEKFKSFMKSNAEIKDFIQTAGFSNNTPMSKIVINSKKLSNDLCNLGIIPRKSLILDVPKIDSNFYLPFILGYFDGDGSIFETAQKEYGISIVGTKEILNWINDLLNISKNLEKRREDDLNTYYIRCGGIQKPYLIMKRLYESCPTHLDRKYEMYKKLETVVLNGNIQ